MSSDYDTDPFVLFQKLERVIRLAIQKLIEVENSQGQRCEAIAKASQKAVEASETFAAARPRLMLWTALSTALLLSAAGLACYWVGHRDGWQTGYVIGRDQALNENAAASWANTYSGKVAKRLDDRGDIQRIAQCNFNGFKVISNDHNVPWCVVKVGDEYQGWRMP